MEIRSMRVRWFRGELSDLAYELERSRFCQFGSLMWQPQVNAFLCGSGICVCVDLAGVEKTEITLHVEPRRLTLQGVRKAPEPEEPGNRPLHILAFEIDYGPFFREVMLPAAVVPEEATAEQRNGFLWITLPLKKP